MTKWTENQQKTIDTRGKNILVSAAAGSGKTAVLIERIIRLVLDDKVDIDKFLITTFTRAAAAEMKERLEKAIKAEMSRPDSDRAFLRRQLQLLPSAGISTFHSFAIDIIRQYFYLSDIEPGFGICDQVQEAIMQRDAVNSLFENRFETDYERFAKFLTARSSASSDEKLKANIKETYKELRSIPHYFKWAREKVELLARDNPAEAMGLWDFACEYSLRVLMEAEGLLEEAAEILETAGAENLYGKASEDAERLSQLLDNCYSNGSGSGMGKEARDTLRAYIKKPSFNTMRALKDEKEAYEEVREQVSELRTRAKNLIGGLKDRYWLRDEASYDEDLKMTYEDTEYLIGLLQDFEKLYRERKDRDNLIDFDDVMHLAIEILQKEEAADELRCRYEYIFIDEYQDSNLLQEEIVSAFARDNNLFMVGDVKQSIYKFRLAEPELFMARDKKYRSGRDENSVVIDLNSNFRSKKRVTDFVNGIFSNIMDGYDDAAALHCSVSDEYPGVDTGIHIIEKSAISDEFQEPMDVEAAKAAEIIKSCVGTEVFDTKAGTYKKIGYRDIAVLSRSTAAVASIERYLNGEGIPAFGETGGGYFESVEIQVFINLLKVIDNMNQDVPLISVMRSVLFDFNMAQLAMIRIAHKDGSFHSAVKSYLDEGEDEGIKSKIRNMIASLTLWKEMSRSLPLDELLRRLLYDTGYYDYCSGLPVGGRRISNLRLITEKAADFERKSHKGLYGFLSYIEAMKDSNVSEAEAKMIGEGEDVVRVMTVHKSKGLEFPVVILAGAGKKTGGGAASSVSLHKDFGLGIAAVNRADRWHRKTLLQNVINGKKSAEELDEEIRILYVALTRAKDRLEIIGRVADAQKLRERPGKGSYIDMIYGSALSMDNVNVKIYDEPDTLLAELEIKTGGEGESDDESGTHRDANDGTNVDIKGIKNVNNVNNEEPAEDKLDAESIREIIERRLGFKYPHEDSGQVRSKYSVTKLIREADADDSYETLIADEDYIAKAYNKLEIAEDIRSEKIESEIESESKPESRYTIGQFKPAGEKNRLTAAEAGTVMHLVMERMDFSRAAAEGRAYVEAFADELAAKGSLSQLQRGAVRAKAIAGFFETDMGIRAAKAYERGHLEREREFIAERKINGITTVIQGIIDCYFYEEDHIVLIDWKNRYSPEYEKQIALYKEALESATGLKVSEAGIYMFDKRKFMRIV